MKTPYVPEPVYVEAAQRVFDAFARLSRSQRGSALRQMASSDDATLESFAEYLSSRAGSPFDARDNADAAVLAVAGELSVAHIFPDPALVDRLSEDEPWLTIRQELRVLLDRPLPS